MADVTQKYEDNAEGKFYVDNTCIDCDACRQVAPDNFDRNDEGGYSYVSKQPENEQEAEQCMEALDVVRSKLSEATENNKKSAF